MTSSNRDYHHWTSIESETIRIGYARGKSATEIAASLGVNVTAVRNRAAKIGARHRGWSRTLEQRFWDYVSCEPNTGCWLWDGACDGHGYGQMRMRGGLARLATHVSLEMVGRPVPSGMNACHHCDFPPCVNPDHLFIGTQRDNVNDARAKGRMSKPPIAVKGQGRLTTTCRVGHELAVVGIYVSRTGVQNCKLCARLNKIALRARRKAAGLTTRGTVPLLRPFS